MPVEANDSRRLHEDLNKEQRLPKQKKSPLTS